MKRSTLFIASLALAAGSALAADVATSSAPPTAKQLAALCANCGLVTETKTEKRKGKPSGVGAVGGAVAGGVVGNKVGDSTTATVGGAVVGGVVGNEIEKRLKKHTVWITTVTLKDGKTQRFEVTADPGLKVGDTVTVAEGKISRK